MIIIACVERYVLFTRLRVAVTITESTLDAACGASITRRDASMVYMLRNLIEDAVSDATSDFSSVSKPTSTNYWRQLALQLESRLHCTYIHAWLMAAQSRTLLCGCCCSWV